jgi:hypothetical protein
MMCVREVEDPETVPCPIAGFGFSGVEPSGSTVIDLVTKYLQIQVFHTLGQLSSRIAYILIKPHLKSNISFNSLQNNLLEMSHTFVLAHKIVGNIF